MSEPRPTNPGRRWWQQPLLHFLLIGAAVFASRLWFDASRTPPEQTIRVDRPALLTYLQERSRVPDPDGAAATLDGMSAEQLDGLVKDYVRQEVLYREARALGLDENDSIIRDRLIRKLESINGDQEFFERIAEAYDVEVDLEAGEAP